MKEGSTGPRNRFFTYRDGDSGPVAHTHGTRIRHPYYSAIVPAGQTVTLEEWHRQNGDATEEKERVAA